MNGISIDTMRVGNRYRLVNYEDVFEFEILSRVTDMNFLLKDLHTLEKYELEDLIRFGKGKDFEIRNI